MGEQWYYAKGDQQQGPYTLEQVNEFAEAGEFGPTDLVWTDTMEDWLPAAEVGEITLPATPNKPPPILPSCAVASVEAAAPQRRSKSLPRVPAIIWPILIFVAAGLLFLAFVLPWWGIDVKSGRDASAKQRETANEVQEKNAFWYFQHIRPLSKMQANGDDGVILWGWHTGAGLTGLFFALLILPIAILPLCIKAIRRWSWIGRYLVAIPGCVMLIMFLVWFFGAPSRNVSPILYQGLYLGPYLIFLAGGTLFLTGTLGGTLGLLEFLTWLKSRSDDVASDTAQTSIGSNDTGLEIE